MQITYQIIHSPQHEVGRNGVRKSENYFLSIARR